MLALVFSIRREELVAVDGPSEVRLVEVIEDEDPLLKAILRGKRERGEGRLFR